VGYLERESIAAHLESYQEGYEDGYKRGWNERAESDRLRRDPVALPGMYAPGGTARPVGFRDSDLMRTVAAATAPRRRSRWNKWVANKANRIYFKGKKRKLNFKLMAKKYRAKYGIKR